MQTPVHGSKPRCLPCAHSTNMASADVQIKGDVGRIRQVCEQHLGSIQSHAEPFGPVQLLSKWRAGAGLPQHVKQGPSSTELSDDAWRLQTQPHEHDHVGVPQTCHDGHLQPQAPEWQCSAATAIGLPVQCNQKYLCMIDEVQCDHKPLSVSVMQSQTVKCQMKGSMYCQTIKNLADMS